MSRASVLIVDDAQVNLHFLTDVLTKSGYAARPFTDSLQALESAETESPDIILLDIMMPGMNGYEVCERLKAGEKTRDIPVLFLSALNQEVDKIKAFAVGGVDFIAKPFQIKEVLARIETHLSLRNLQKRLEENNLSLQREIAERKRADENLRSYAERLRILHEIDQSIVAARSPETIAVAAVGRIRQLIPCQRVIVIAMKSDGQVQTLTAESDGEFALDIDLDVYRGVFDNPALRSGLVHGIPNLPQLMRRSPLQDHLLAEGVQAYVVVPLLVHDELVGTLHLESNKANVFDTSHIAIAAEVAGLLAVAIRQARLYELAQQEIAERKLAEEALRERTLELEARNAELDAFAHTVAHDLKTPLTAVVGFSDLAQRRAATMTPEILTETLNVISQNGRRMANIINSLLLLASVRKMEDIPTDVLNMTAIVASAIDRLSDMVAEYQAELIVPDVWPEAYGYGPWIEEVWVNYLSNAMKYGETPPRLELGAATLSPRTARFWVQDNGEGLSPEQKSKLFIAFTRLQQTSVEGHGLGLSIVHRIITRLNGEVGVESTVGKGSRFHFTLPCPLSDTTPVNWNWASPEELKRLRGKA